MSMKVTFNGHDLRDYFDVIQGFAPHSGGDFSPVVLDAEGPFGVPRFVYTNTGSKLLEMPFMIQGNIREKYDALQRILYVKEPKPLTMECFPNRVFYAVQKGDMDFQEIYKEGIGTITWLIVDGYGYGTSPVEFTFKEVDGQLEVDLVNNGTRDAIVDYEIHMNHENGYVGIFSEYGAIEIGDKSERDGDPNAKMSVLLTRNDNGDFNNWNNVTGRKLAGNGTDKFPVTNMGSITGWGGWVGQLPASFTNTGNHAYFGAMKELLIPEKDQGSDWYLWARAWFETGIMGQTGNWTLAFADPNDRIIAATSITKDDRNGNTARVVFETGDENNNTLVRQRIYFQPSYWIPPNPYGSQSRDTNRNMFDVRKEGRKIRFFFNGRYHTWEVPQSVADLKLGKVQFFVGQYRGRTSVTKQTVSHMKLRDLDLYRINVPYFKDEPNRYHEGSDIRLDGIKETVFLNNMPRPEDEVVGSTYFRIPPGTTKVICNVSEFSRPFPTVKAIVREVFG